MAPPTKRQPAIWIPEDISVLDHLRKQDIELFNACVEILAEWEAAPDDSAYNPAHESAMQRELLDIFNDFRRPREARAEVARMARRIDHAAAAKFGVGRMMPRPVAMPVPGPGTVG